MADEIPKRPRPMLTASHGGARTPPPMTGGNRMLIIGFIALVVLFVIGPLAARRATDFLWFREIGYERVFVTRIAAQWALGASAAIVAFAILYANARVALRDIAIAAITAIDRLREKPRADALQPMRLAETLALPVCLLFTALVAVIAASQWRTLLQFFHRTPFGTTDPVFGRDIGWYVFTLPMLDVGIELLTLTILVAVGIIALPIYYARGDISARGWKTRIEPDAQRHLAILLAALMAVTGARVLLIEIPSLLQSAHGPLQGASYTDLHVRLPMLRVVGVLAMLGAIPILVLAWRGRLLHGAVGTYAGYIVARLLLLGVVPALFQRLVVQPNELARESPQIVHHIAATRAAWGIDSVERRELGSQRRLTLQDIEANQTTLSNVRLWDRAPLLQTYGQIQAIRTYYDFVAVDDDRYRIQDELRQVLLSARELNTAALPTRSFINEHLTFTHGMGLTLGPSNQVTAEGLPVLFIKDLPPSSSVDIPITQPRIYYGELSNEFVLAPSRQQEFDYPAGEGDAAVYSRYTGTGGVSINSFGRRLLFALRFRSLNILLSRDRTEDTRVLYHRSILDRARLALPFVRFDGDPYLVITDEGRLKWILDAYTTTGLYPYAQRLADGTSYMRNSLKVVIDAYDGDVTAYIADPDDPMIRTLSRIYTGLLRPLSEMPADLRAHVRYPEDLFRVQTSLHATFHMTDPETFYHREDQWQVPASPRNDDDGFMRHIVMRLPGERDPEFILMRPFTPRQKDNLAAWMVARNDGDNYGKLVAYRFPRQSLVFGPTQIVNRINQDTEVSRQVALWDQGGSEVIRGELLVIPIEESLIYVQPLYLRAQGGRIPELKRVIVAHENQVAMDETLEAALRRLFVPGSGAGPAVPAGVPVPATPSGPARDSLAVGGDELLRQAMQHYERARAAQRAEDWAAYGAEMRRLGEVLRRLNAPPPR